MDDAHIVESVGDALLQIGGDQLSEIFRLKRVQIKFARDRDGDRRLFVVVRHERIPTAGDRYRWLAAQLSVEAILL